MLIINFKNFTNIFYFFSYFINLVLYSFFYILKRWTLIANIAKFYKSIKIKKVGFYYNNYLIFYFKLIYFYITRLSAVLRIIKSYKYKFFNIAKITVLVFILNIYTRIKLIIKVYAVVKFNYRLSTRNRYKITIYINYRLSSRDRGRVTTYIKIFKY